VHAEVRSWGGHVRIFRRGHIGHFISFFMALFTWKKKSTWSHYFFYFYVLFFYFFSF